MSVGKGKKYFFFILCSFREAKTYSEEQAQFYAAQVVLALEYLHYMSETTRYLDILFSRTMFFYA